MSKNLRVAVFDTAAFGLASFKLAFQIQPFHI
jgi:hypothetical protein